MEDDVGVTMATLHGAERHKEKVPAATIGGAGIAMGTPFAAGLNARSIAVRDQNYTFIARY